MNSILKNFLFDKHVLVNDKLLGSDQVATIYTLRNKLNIRITDGFEFAEPDMIAYAAHKLGDYIPEPFYRGFPRSVRELTPDALAYDQLVHYTMTYGFGNFEEVGHSVFERVLERSCYSEKNDPKDFRIMSEHQAVEYLKDMADEMLKSTRPINDEMMNTIIYLVKEYDYMPENISGKQNAINMLLYTQDAKFCKFIQLPDVIKLVDTLSYVRHGNERMNKLHLTNQERKFVTRVLDQLLLKPVNFDVVRTCIEKRDTWKGLLHHIHYAPKTESGKAAIFTIYDEDIRSAYSSFQKAMKSPVMDKASAARYLKSMKGNGALLRNLNYILSSGGNVSGVLNAVDAENPLVIIQLQNMFREYNEGPRTFRYIRHNRVRTFNERERKHFLPKETRDLVVTSLEDKLKASLSGKAGKVYIAPGMEKIAVPVNLSAGESGFGIMPTGSRIPLPEGKKIRAFTYWEKVNDIDLSCFGISDERRVEFSWRTMRYQQSQAVTYSGDETSGYNGGSEYFDIDLDAMKEEYPDVNYIIFCNNVYSDVDFSECVCRAGWMARDTEDSGEIYEPKTVQSAYTINAKSTFCYLYAIDIEKREIIWLNIANSSRLRVAGMSELDWLKSYFNTCETMNMRKLFEYAAEEVVSSPDEADLVVGDVKTDKEQIRSYEFEKAFSYLT